jgi:ephrin-B
MCVVCFRFRIDNTDHIIDVNKGNIPFEYDQVNIICPVYMPGTHEEDAEKYIIYNVSDTFFGDCCGFPIEFKSQV